MKFKIPFLAVLIVGAILFINKDEVKNMFVNLIYFIIIFESRPSVQSVRPWGEGGFAPLPPRDGRTRGGWGGRRPPLKKIKEK